MLHHFSPEKPRYFLFRGKPTVLITSAKHYGAVIHADSSYTEYLDPLGRSGLNCTCVCPGAYCTG